MTNLIESLKAKSEAESAKAVTDWQSLIAKVASDQATEAEVSKLLKSTGKTLEELQVAVARQTRINSLRGEITGYPEAVAEHIAAGTALHEFIKRRHATIRDLDSELSRCRGAERGAEYRVQQLQESASELRRLTGENVVLRAIPALDAELSGGEVKIPVIEVELPPVTRTVLEVALPSDV